MRYVVAQLDSWRVIHDASGKVVIRRTVKGKEEVLAIAKWQGDKTVERQHHSPTFPSVERWEEIDQALRSEIEAGRKMGPDPRLDPGELPPPTGANKKAEPLTKGDYVKLVVVVLFLGAVAFGMYQIRDYWLWIVQGSGDGANGEACSQDSDCRSDNCARKAPGAKSRVCVPNERKRGERCTSDSECSSGSCERRVCN